MRKFYLIILLAFVSQVATAQKSKIETLMTSKQVWTVRDVKSSRPYWEIGEKLTIRVDGTFYHDRNNYAKLGGDWIVNGNELVLTYNSFIEERKRIPYEYKIKKWKDGGIQLAFRNRNNKKEKVYLK